VSGAVTVGIDIGTTSVKAVAATADGEVVASTRVAHSCVSPTPARLEHDAAAAWVDGVTSAWSKVSEGLDVLGACVAAMVPSIAAVDSNGRPLSPGLLYGDERGRTAAADSSPTESGEFAGMAAWCASEYPDAAGLWPAQAVANNALCGRGAIDTGTAMTTMPLFDGLGWSEEECAKAGVRPDHFPDLVPGAEPIGDIDGVPLAGGTIDAFAQQIVAGADEPGDVLVILGATLITWCVRSEWTEVDGWWTVPHSAPGLTLIGGPSNAGALFVDRVRTSLGGTADESDGEMDLADIPVWLPYIRGERVPLHDPHRRASLHDFTRTHGSAEVLRAAHEASGFSIRRAVEATGGAGRIVATGGGTRDARWVQALADATGLPVHVAAVADGGALGAAFIGRQCAGLESNIAAAAGWARTGHIVEPAGEWSEAVDQRYSRFIELTG
jgi:xylulokinase